MGRLEVFERRSLHNIGRAPRVGSEDPTGSAAAPEAEIRHNTLIIKHLYDESGEQKAESRNGLQDYGTTGLHDKAESRKRTAEIKDYRTTRRRDDGTTKS